MSAHPRKSNRYLVLVRASVPGTTVLLPLVCRYYFQRTSLPGMPCATGTVSIQQALPGTTCSTVSHAGHNRLYASHVQWYCMKWRRVTRATFECRYRKVVMASSFLHIGNIIHNRPVNNANSALCCDKRIVSFDYMVSKTCKNNCEMESWSVWCPVPDEFCAESNEPMTFTAAHARVIELTMYR